MQEEKLWGTYKNYQIAKKKKTTTRYNRPWILNYQLALHVEMCKGILYWISPVSFLENFQYDQQFENTKTQKYASIELYKSFSAVNTYKGMQIPNPLYGFLSLS